MLSCSVFGLKLVIAESWTEADGSAVSRLGRKCLLHSFCVGPQLHHWKLLKESFCCIIYCNSTLNVFVLIVFLVKTTYGVTSKHKLCGIITGRRESEDCWKTDSTNSCWVLTEFCFGKHTKVCFLNRKMLRRNQNEPSKSRSNSKSRGNSAIYLYR